MHLWAVLGGRDVKLDEPIDSLFTGPLADAEVRRLATNRPSAARLNADFVEPAVLRPDLPKPVRRKRMIHVARIQQMSQRSLDAEPVQRLLLILAAAVTQLGSRLANLASITRSHRKGPVQHEPRRAVIPIDMRRRERQLRPNPLEPMPQRVFVQLTGLRR